MINKSAGVRNVFSSAHIERGRGSRSAKLIHLLSLLEQALTRCLGK